MSYGKYTLYNVIGSVAWITLIVYAGYLFGNMPMVRQHFGLVVIGIVVVSVLPMVIQFGREWHRSRKGRRNV